MIQHKKFLTISLVALSLFVSSKVFSQDPNFHIYICFGQSNMEGNAAVGSEDKTVNDRFRVMEAVDCSNLGRVKGNWYTAVPPLCRCSTGLTPVDYFGRKLLENLPANIKVGIVMVAVAGCKIELFDKNNFQTYAATAPSWMTNIINEYGGNPYARLVEIAKLAQKEGVIKGILLHQGESNTGDNAWPSKVKAIYDNLITDLNLKPEYVPLLAGELVNADQGGACASMNSIIAKLPQTISNSFVISSKGCTANTDRLHFNAAGYREFGRRYGARMLSILGYDPSIYYEPECAAIGRNWDIKADVQASNGLFVSAKAGLNNISSAPSDSASAIYFPFTVNMDTTYYIYARVKCPTINNDSFWGKMDNEKFTKYDKLTTSDWQWLKLGASNLVKGSHTFTVAICMEGAQLDKICITKIDAVPTGTGDDAKNLCRAYPTTGIMNSEKLIDGYALLDNYPNPFNPSTTITFNLPVKSFVTLQIFDSLGREVSKLVSKEMFAGTYSQQWNAEGMSSGVYYCRLVAKATDVEKSESHVGTKKLVLLR